MSDIQPWLVDLGLERYLEVLRRNDVDLAVAADLSEQDLEQLGLSLGHRRRFLAAAALLRPPQPSLPVSPAAAAPPTGLPQVERRQVTVVFADLVGSAALSSQMDPEDFNRLLHGYRDVCAAMILKYDGHVAQYLGDGVLAYFGYPRGQEQAAERAVRAGLDIVREVERLQHRDGLALRARVGVATGLVVGASVDAREQGDRTVVGDAPNLAARLQALAAPGDVLVGAVTRQLTGEFFDYASDGEHTIKGFEQPVAAWRVLGERRIESRFAAARGAFTGPIVARERELAFLADAWQRAALGHGHGVLLSGEAGMGKSRLLEAFAEQVRGMPHRLLRCQCSPYHRNSSLYPVVQLLRHEAAIQAELPADENLRRMEGLLAGVSRAARRDLLLIAELLELATADRLSPMEMTPRQRNAETLAILEDFLLAAPDGAPVLLLIEDVHWSDPSTQTLVERLLGRIATRPALALITHRPELGKAWGTHAHATTIPCKQLGAAHCDAMIRRAIAARAIDDALVEEIVARSDGVPLYVEELTKAVLDTQDAPASRVPLTLQDSLMARLDRLGEAKEIALVASVMGRQFSHTVLAAASGLPESTLDRALARLIDAGLVFVVGEHGQGEYSFNHSLVQEAAYETLSHGRRRQLHRALAGVLELQAEGQQAISPEIIAHHFSRAAEPERSCAFWILAAEKARARSAYAEAIANLKAALAEAGRIGDAAKRARATLDVQLKLGSTFIIQAGPLSVDAAAVLSDAHALATETGADPQLFEATWGLYLNAGNSRRFDVAKTLGDELLDIGDRLADDDLRLEGLHHRWGFSYFTGDTAKMIEHARDGVGRYDPLRHHRFAHVFGGHDPGVCAHCVEAIGLALSGLPQQVMVSVDAAVALADSLPHPVTLAFSMGMGSVGLQLADQLDACRALAQREVGVARKYDLPLQQAFATFQLGLIRSRQGDLAAGVALMEANHAASHRHGFLGVYPDVVLADALNRQGRGKEALELVNRTLDSLTMPEVGLHVSELWRLRGELLLAESPANVTAAAEDLRKAVRIAAGHGAATYHERAESSLARMFG
jgi:class 3 adenylate cyclase/DNA-binding transcriptional ArsR family regulator